MKILTADFGTSAVKIGIFDKNLNELASNTVTYQYFAENDRAEIDPETIYAAFIKGCSQISDQLAGIDIFAFDALCPSLVAMDAEGTPLYPSIIHLDRRSFAQSRYAINKLPKERFLEINGNLPFAGGISLTSMLWLKQHLPDVYNKTAVLGHMCTYLHKKMVGEFLIDPSNASFTGLYKTFTNDGWSDEILGAMDLDSSKLPQVRPSLSFAGRLQSGAAREIGLREGTPVLTGANDSCAAAYGAGVTNNGDIINISGSSEIMMIATDNPIPNEKYYCRTSMEDGVWLYLAITVGGLALEWFMKQFCREMDVKTFYNDYLRRVCGEGVPNVRFRPHLSGDRHSLAKKTGGFSGLTMKTTREDMLRGLLYGILEPNLNMMKIVGKSMKINSQIQWTGGMISDEYQKFKEGLLRQYTFIPKKNCSLIGLAKAAIKTANESPLL